MYTEAMDHFDGGPALKEFITTFFMCLVVCVLATFFFANFINNIWAVIVIAAFALALLITAYTNQDSRIKELERKIASSLNGEQN